MSSNLGSMVIQLAANTAQLQSDLGRAAHMAQDYADKTTKIFATVAGVFGVGFGVDAFKEFIGGAIEAQDQALKLSQKVGISTEAIAGLASAANKAGVDTESFQTAMVKLSKSVADAANGGKQSAAQYAALGISLKDANGNIKTSDTLLKELADKFAGYKDGVAKTADAVAIFGKAGANMIPLLNGGSAAIQKQIDLVNSLGASFTKEGSAQAEKFNDTLKDLEIVSKGVGNTIATAVLPALNQLADEALKFFTSNTWKQWLADISAAFITLAEHVDDIVAGIKLLGEVALDYIGFRVVKAFAEASAAAFELAVKTAAANSAAAEMGLSFQKGIGDSLKQIGYLNVAVGTVTAGIAGWQIGTTLYNQSSVVQKFANNLMVTFDAAWTVVSAGAKVAWLEIEKAFYTVIDGIERSLSESLAKMATNFAKLPDALGGSKISAQFAALSAAIAPSVDHVSDLNDQIVDLKDTAARDLEIAKRSWGEYGTGADAAAKSTDAAGESAKKNAPNIAGLGKAAEDAAKAARRLADDFLSAQKMLDTLAGSFGGPYQKSAEQYAAAILEADKMAVKFAADGMKVADVQKFIADATQLATQRFQEQTDAQQQIDKLLEGITDKYAEQNRLIGLTGTALQVETEYQRLKTESDKAMLNVMGPLTEAQQNQIDSLHGLAAAHVQLSEKAKLDQEVAKGWQSIWSTAGNAVADTFAKVIVEGGSLFDGLKNLAKQTVEQIIAYFAKLAVINPILNSIFGGMGGGFSLLPTLANAATGGGGGGTGLAGILGGGGGGANGGASLFSPTSWMSAGQNLFSGFQTAGGNAWANMTGAYTYNGGVMTGPPSDLANGFMGPSSSLSGGAPSYGGYSSGLGQGIGIAGGIYAGYSAYKGAGGGAAGLAAGAAYGVGTYFAGAAVSTALAGGLSAGLAAIPVVGWIAIAAMLIDKFSGGKLFGTAWSTKASTTSLSIGPEGGDASAFLSQTKQGALFSGTKTRDKTVDAGADAQAAAQGLFDAVQKTMVTAAHQLTIDVPPVIQAALDIVNTYDKKGKVTSTKYVVDILGKKYEEASQELAATRIAAESIVATVAASEAGKAASTIAEQWRSSADTLMDGAQFLLAATVDLNKGKDLLGPGGTLTGIADVVTGLQQGNEKLLDTYARVVAENDLMTQALALTGVNIGKTGAEFVKFADATAQAAGGIDALSQLVQTFNQAYFSASEIAAQSLKSLQDASNLALTGIGEDPTESMAKFKQDFLAALPNLTPEQLAQWYQAGVALASYTKAVTDSATQLAQAQQQYAAFEMNLYGDQFINAFANAVQAEQQQIDQANALAKAAGLAGASQQDLTEIMTQGSFAIGKALADLANGIQADIATIYGAKVQDDPSGMFAVSNNKAMVEAAAQQKQNQNISAAYDLIQKLGDFAFASGKSMDDVFKQFNIGPDQLAQTLGITPDQVRADFKLATDQAASLTTMAAQGAEQIGIQQDILAAIRGQPLPYDLSALVAPTVSAAAPSDKPGGHNIAPAPSSGGFNIADPGGTRQVVAATTSNGDKLDQVVALLRDIRGAGGTILRNQRDQFATPVRRA